MDETKLPLKFTCDGFDLEQVWREDDWAIYSQSKRGKVITWELIRIGHAAGRTMPKGDVVGPREVYPSPSQWGQRAWSCISLARAHEKRAEFIRGNIPSTEPDRIHLPPPQAQGDEAKPIP